MILPQFTGKLSHKVVKNICSCHNSLASYHIKLYKYASPEVGIKRTTLALIGTEYRGWCKFSYHGILTSPVPACMVRNNMWAYLEITWIKAYYMEQFLITVFRLLTDFVCLYNYEFWLSLCKIVRSSVILLLPLFM